MTPLPRLLDVVALTDDAPDAGLRRGQVGTVVQVYDDAVEVEFAGPDGQTYAMTAVSPDHLLVLTFEPTAA